MATRKKNTKEHHARKDQGEAERHRKARKVRNEARPKQWFCSDCSQWVRGPHKHVSDPGWTLPEPPGSTLMPSDT